MNLFITIIGQFIFIFVATVGFSIIFNVPKEELIFCGIVGTVCYVFYYLIANYYGQMFFGVVIGSFVATCMSRILTYYRKMPVTLYVIPAIIPLAPGGYIYNAMHSLISSNFTQSVFSGLAAVKIAVALAIGISISLSLPKFFFSYGEKKSI